MEGLCYVNWLTIPSAVYNFGVFFSDNVFLFPCVLEGRDMKDDIPTSIPHKFCNTFV
jgi:hypothetical protein